MKNIAYIIIALLMASCSKLLDQMPQDRITDENFWENGQRRGSGCGRHL